MFDEEKEIKDLIEEHGDYVRSLAWIHLFYPHSHKELYQAGLVGLYEAYKNFDEDRNIKFTTYAYKYIIGEIINYSNQILYPQFSKDKKQLANKISDMGEKHYDEHLYEMDDYQIATILNLEEEEVSHLRQANQMTKSLSSPVDASIANSDSLYEHVEQRMFKSPEKVVDDNIMRNVLIKSMDKLSYKQKKVISYYYGVVGYEKLKSKNIAYQLNVSQSMITSYRNAALRTLRKDRKLKQIYVELNYEYYKNGDDINSYFSND